MALDSLGALFSYVATWQAQKNVSGLSPITQNQTKSKKQTHGTAAANNAAGGGNELSAFVQTVGASSSVSIDLTSLTSVVGTAAISLVRVKAIVLHLLSAADDATLGTSASAIKVGDSTTTPFVSQSSSGWLLNGTLTSSPNSDSVDYASALIIPNGCFNVFGCANAAGVAVDSSHKLLKITNLSSTTAAKVLVVLAGATT